MSTYHTLISVDADFSPIDDLTNLVRFDLASNYDNDFHEKFQ